MKKNLILFFCVICFYVSAQHDSVSVNPKYPVGKIIFKWSPLNLYSRFPTFQLALEQKITDNFAIQYDFGPVVRSNILDKTESHKRGFKARFQVRSYIKSNASHWRFFVAPEIYYSQVDFKSGKTFIINQDNIAYYKYIKFNRRYEEKGINLSLGSTFTVYRFNIDFQLGIAARHVYYTKMGKPAESNYEEVYDNQDRGTVLSYEKNNSLFRPTGCVRLGYIIK